MDKYNITKNGLQVGAKTRMWLKRDSIKGAMGWGDEGGMVREYQVYVS